MKNEKEKGIPRLLELAGEKKALLVWSGILSTVSVFLMLVPYLSVYVVMAELLKHATDITSVDASYVLGWAAWGVAGVVFGYFFMYVGGMCSHIAAFRILYGIRVKLSDHIGRLPLGYFNKNATGKIKKIVELDVERIELFIAHQLPDLINTAVMLAAMIGTMFYLDIWFALACVIPMLIGFASQYSMMAGKKAKAGLKEYFDALENINTSSIQYVRGMPSIKIFGQTVHSFRKFHDDMIKYRDFSLKYTDNFQNGYVTFKTIILSLSTFILPAGLFFLSGKPDNMAFALTLLFFLVLAPGISAPIFKLNSFASALGTITEGVARIDAMLEEDTLHEPKACQKPSSYDVQFHNVSFSYGGQGGVDVLTEINFTAPQGRITALVGPSGSGKSTIAQLIPRFWDVQKGCITIGGVDIRDMGMHELMETMSFVFQDTFLFSDTLYNNIQAGRPTATKEEVYAAARAAQCHDFIERLPSGYDTLIGEGGVYLSGGEEQRVSVARAILKNAPILVLDEATAYADPENEYQMQLALRELIKGKTVLIIAHRLTTICEANQILVLKEGQINDGGTHAELLSRGGLYKSMWDAYTSSVDWQIDHLQKQEALVQ
ncbi:ABC transporter ATP-binding protein/permease [Paenibacillus apiarius]|uniref:ABC transporter ATP-binding protein/permease n=2 Tax=Paenibacillus apiarius TaxID=46240 RepID=A0ABT4DVA3_9BACL|nr:ABC transporter ATP-binding protein [Paenibacillus apiarius]MCY9514843.1 ABC transporter ATP-binding protein/permease [Paenibacillus apiarius]MCY9521277.1 ABC transporter ATP-binding protein/permease [Paenibacillus apiarius]MCY9553993.1 ABC transporter ATP-binding protein/permease [Paenibacillus apiarius]MCY9560367.1 ABC transporter ATP-binding protein/permease [Paenibacillus apiarius]MCY9682295.1 ABC transporter ATP-binding protein/permease [Paenibacillus apiarius]